MASNKEVVEKDNGFSRLDPLVLLKYVGKVVEVITIYGQSVKGTVVTIDPITESYIVTSFNSDKTDLTLIMGRSIKCVRFVEDVPISFNFKHSTQCKDNEKSDIESLDKMKNWFSKNKIPFEQDKDVLKIFDTVTVHPPYRLEDVISSNEIVLHKILGIIERMPAD